MAGTADRVLVAGATGYIGRKLALALLDAGYEVRCMVRRPEAASDLAEAGCEVVRGDVLDPASLEGTLDGISTAYYLG
ncbi:MAG: SDR family oxidoreductase, partial [Solirubrobacterales bacterium]